MSSYTKNLYHIIYSTKYREPTLTKADRPKLFRYMWGLLKNKRCHLYQLNGVEDHLHLVVSIHPSVAVADLVKDLKLSSWKFIKEEQLFENFRGWQKGYGAFTYSQSEKFALVEYVKKQEVHHQQQSSLEEYIELLNFHQIEFDEHFLE